MTTTDLLRPSNDGHQFHYLRAARLCLELLSPNATLVAVTIEGVPQGEEIEAGLDVIDMGLYYGSVEITKASRIHYRQFKHSTVRPDEEWLASGLTNTLKGFADRYSELVLQFGREDVAARFSFEFETNRPIAPSVAEALTDLASGKETRVC